MRKTNREIKVADQRQKKKPKGQPSQPARPPAAATATAVWPPASENTTPPAMMSSAAWDGQDQHMASGPDDEFNQFLDMSGMGNMPDASGIQFDFHGFQDGGAQPMMSAAAAAAHQHQQHQHQHQHQQQPRQAPGPDALMTDPDPSSMIPRSDGLLQNHTPAMATPVTHPAMSAHMLATSAPDSISNIDAQIQYLQQQKFHQQQRQIHEQQATFYGTHGHSVPPTPQSLEMPPGSGQFYSQAEQMPQRAAYDRYHQRIAEQADVSCNCTPCGLNAPVPVQTECRLNSD